ncbi:MAG: GNAT family N-acetyltransferase [Candidatus Roizmanbacteria bacterium]|nr:GNAT family N-acetyltransferase [Candidatus Roizmanbacteria bacterium]
MDKFKFITSEGEPDPIDSQNLSEGMLAHHAKSGHPRESQKYSVFLKVDEKVLGGVIVTFLWTGMEINSLWVDESIRKQGWGRKLMEAVEEEGRKRGSTISYTNTFHYQAPKFYEKLGYKCYGKIDNFPAGSYLTYYIKKLVK